MKTRFYVSLLWLALVCVPAAAQSTNAAPATTSAPDPAKIAEFQKRFNDGYALQQAGKLTEARAVYDGILADEPSARRSLLEAGRISLKLREYDKADAYLSKLHDLEPTYPPALEMLIQANQGLKHDVKVIFLIKEYRELHDSGKVPDLSKSLYFVRELIPATGTDAFVFYQYFDYTASPNIVWKGQLVDDQGNVKRQLSLIYDYRATQDLRAKNPSQPNAEQFLLIEDVLVNGQPSRVDAYFQMFSLPEYKKVRNTMLAIFAGSYKPVYTQAVSGAPGSDPESTPAPESTAPTPAPAPAQ